MLRRYNSTNLDTIVLKGRRTTLGSSTSCDIVLKGRGVAPIHATIESNSSGYFLKDISLSSRTRVNDRPVFGQVQIHSGDLIQVGMSPPLVFDSEWMFGTRPNSAKIGKKEVEPIVEEASSSSSTALPMITGKKIHPLSQQDSFSDSSLKKRTIYSKKDSERSSASSTESQRFYCNSRSIGNNLLQRVVKLQAELISKDEKIRQLTTQPSLLYYHPSLPPPFPQPLAPPLSLATPLHQAPPLSMAPPTHQAPPPRPSLPKLPKSFELFAYRAFIGAITSQLRQFNDRVIRHPQRDSAELFNSMCRAVDIPLSSRIGEIEKYCEAVLIDNDFEDGDELTSRLENFIRESRREKILELTHELEVLMPLIRDAASNARENIKVCNVFTQWSRGFGDLLRKNSFSATTLFQAIEDLKTEFADAHMSRHWLPPSITPILRLAALELEKRDGDITPNISPRPPGILDRKKSIDMTLDTCLSQVETIIHEMDYHLVRLYNKAKDYSTFQPLDLDTVTRISKIVESMKTSVDLLSEHSFKDEPRPNSVLFFEITNDDLKNAGSSSGSQSSLKKVSVAPKITDIFSEDDEILEERREVEGEMLKVIGRIGEMIGGEEEAEPMRNQGMISVDATVLKTLIQQSQRLLNSYESSENEEAVRRKRSAPPIIMVDESEGEEEGVDVKPVEAEKVEDPDSMNSEKMEDSENQDTKNSTKWENRDFDNENLESSDVQNPEKMEDSEIKDTQDSINPENSESQNMDPPNSMEPEIMDTPNSINPENPESENTDTKDPTKMENMNSEVLTSSENQDTPNSMNPENPILSKNMDPENPESENQDTSNSMSSESPICSKPANPDGIPIINSEIQNPENQDTSDSIKSENRENQDTPESSNPKNPNSENQETRESIKSENQDPSDTPNPEDQDPPIISITVPPLNLTSTQDPTTPEVTSPRQSPEDPNFGLTSSESKESEDPSESKDPEDVPIQSGSDLPFQLIMPEQPGNPPGSESASPDDVRDSEDVAEDEEGIPDDSESEDDKTTVLYIPSQATPQELTPQSSQNSDEPLEEEPEDLIPHVTPKPIANGHVLRETRSEESTIMSSHLKSHFNTANGKPHITYQYPIRRYYSPPMKRRSKSEDQKKIRDTLKNRPPFVLY